MCKQSINQESGKDQGIIQIYEAHLYEPVATRSPSPLRQHSNLSKMESFSYRSQSWSIAKSKTITLYQYLMISTKCHLKSHTGYSRRTCHLRSKIFMNLEGWNWSRIHIYVPQLKTKKSRLCENRRHIGLELKQKEGTKLK
jgi:hypothetical protein